MKQYKTGKNYKEFLLKNEATLMRFEENHINIFIFERGPVQETVDEIRDFDPFFQIYVKNNIIFLLIKFKTLDWIDVPYVFEGTSPKPPKDDAAGYACTIYFADILTGKLLVQRHLALSNGLSKALYFAIEEQKKHLPNNIVQKINSIRASFHPNEIARLSLGK